MEKTLYQTLIDAARTTLATDLVCLISYPKDSGIILNEKNNYKGFFPYDFSCENKNYHVFIERKDAKVEEDNLIQIQLSIGNGYVSSDKTETGILKFAIKEHADKTIFARTKAEEKVSFPKLTDINEIISNYQKSIPDKLYKYSFYYDHEIKDDDQFAEEKRKYFNFKNDYLTKGIKEKTLFFSDSIALNDLYDGTNCLYSLYAFIISRKLFNSDQLSLIEELILNLNENPIIDIFKHKVVIDYFIMYFSDKNKEISEKLVSIKTDYLKTLKIKICSMTEHPDNILMRSHYGNSNNGICLEYDKRSLLNVNSEDFGPNATVIIGKVEYAKEIPNLKLISYLDNFISQNVKLYFLQLMLAFFKSEEWTYEKEWRIVIITNQDKKFAHNVEASKLIFGANWTKEEIDKFNIRHLGDAKLKRKKIVFEKRNYKLRIEDL